jgi:hypothetical protein
MNTWWVITFDQYYPNGGLADVDSQWATEEEANKAAEALKGKYDSVEVVDITDMLYTNN